MGEMFIYLFIYLTETSPSAHIQLGNLTHMTVLAEDCCEKTAS